MSEEKNTFVMIGKTGDGENALENTSVGEKNFQSSDSSISVTSAISKITQTIKATKENEKEAYSVLCNFQKDPDEAISKAAVENLGSNVAKSLNLKKFKAEKELQDKKMAIQQFKFKLLDDKINVINDKLDSVNENDSDSLKKIEQIEKDTNTVKTELELEKPIISESMSDALELSFNKVLDTIKLKKDERLQKENAADILTSLNELKTKIMQTEFKCQDIFAIISTFKKDLNEIELLMLNRQFKEVDKETLSTTKNWCLNYLDELNSKAVFYLEENISNISTTINSANPDEKNIRDKMQDIIKSLETLKAKNLEFLSARIKTCETDLKALQRRTELFQIHAWHYDNLVTLVDKLEMPCKVHHYESLLENTNSLLTRVKENIKNETDCKKLSEKLLTLLEVIKKLQKRNDWGIAGEVVVAFPLVGYFLRNK